MEEATSAGSIILSSLRAIDDELLANIYFLEHLVCRKQERTQLGTNALLLVIKEDVFNNHP